MFYPDTVAVPTILQTDEFIVRPLKATDVTLDYDAVMSSRADLWLQSDNTWPRVDFTLAENLTDLVAHEREHSERIAFTYTVMNRQETECLGCIYINPIQRMLARSGMGGAAQDKEGEHEAWVTFWVRHSQRVTDLDARLLAALIVWFRTEWVFTKVVFAARKAQQRHIHLFAEAQLTFAFDTPRSVVYLVQLNP